MEVLGSLNSSSRFLPCPPTSRHGKGFPVTHFPEAICGQRRSKSSTTVEGDFGVLFGDKLFNVTLKNPSSQVNCPRGMSILPFIIFPNVDEQEIISCGELFLHIFD